MKECEHGLSRRFDTIREHRACQLYRTRLVLSGIVSALPEFMIQTVYMLTSIMEGSERVQNIVIDDI